MFDPESPLDIEELRQRLRKMSDEELLRTGHSCASLCAPENNFGEPPRRVFVIQLEEARAEWRRRHPKALLRKDAV